MKNKLRELTIPKPPKHTMSQIARKYGCSPSFVIHVASGRKKPTERLKKLVAEMFELPVGEIFPDEEVR